MRVILPAYKGNAWIVPAYVHMHKRYWGAPVTLLAESDYSNGQFEFVRPLDAISSIRPDGRFPAYAFSDILMAYMKEIEDEHVLIMLADYLLCAPVDTTRLDQLAEYMSLYHVLRGQVGDDPGCYFGKRIDIYKDIDIWEGNFLPTSLTPGLWDRELLLEMIRSDCASQAMEIDLLDVFLSRGTYRSVAPSPGIMSYLNVIRGSDMSDFCITEEVYNEVKQFFPVAPKGFIH